MDNKENIEPTNVPVDPEHEPITFWNRPVMVPRRLRLAQSMLASLADVAVAAPPPTVQELGRGYFERQVEALMRTLEQQRVDSYFERRFIELEQQLGPVMVPAPTRRVVIPAPAPALDTPAGVHRATYIAQPRPEARPSPETQPRPEPRPRQEATMFSEWRRVRPRRS